MSKVACQLFLDPDLIVVLDRKAAQEGNGRNTLIRRVLHEVYKAELEALRSERS